MTKEIIWNTCLLMFGVFLVLAFTINLLSPSVIPDWYSNSLFPPIGFWNKIKLGLIVGALLVILRYLNIGILSIVNKDLRLLLMLLAYSTPIMMVLIGLHFSADNTMNKLYEKMFPIELMKKEINELRKVGMFKLHLDKSDEFITELAIGRAISKQDGWAYSGQYWNTKTNQVDVLEFIRLDSEKVWQGEDTEFIVEGNRAYEDLVKELGRISEGNFKPIEIKEEWESSEKIKVTFTNKNQQHTIYPKVLNDWADMNGVIGYVNNKILDAIDFQFYYGKGGDILVIGLTKKERKALSKLTGIEFKEIKTGTNN